jgi:hypothetical protein
MLHHVALVRTDVSEELSTSFIRVTRIGEIGTMLAVTSNWHTPPKCQFLQKPHGVTSQKMPFFIVTAVKTSNLTNQYDDYNWTEFNIFKLSSVTWQCILTTESTSMFKWLNIQYAACCSSGLSCIIHKTAQYLLVLYNNPSISLINCI